MEMEIGRTERSINRDFQKSTHRTEIRQLMNAISKYVRSKTLPEALLQKLQASSRKFFLVLTVVMKL